MLAVSRGLQASDRDKDDLEKDYTEAKQRLEQIEFDLQEKTMQLEGSQSEVEQLKDQMAAR